MTSTKFFLMGIGMLLVTAFAIVLIVAYTLSEDMLTKVVEWYIGFMATSGGIFTAAKTYQNINEDLKVRKIINDCEDDKE